MEQGKVHKATDSCKGKWEEGVSPPDHTFRDVLQSCSQLSMRGDGIDVDGRSRKVGFLEQGKAIHAHARIKGYDIDVFVASTLVSMYGKCGSLLDAQIVFDGMSKCDVVCSTGLMSAYVEYNQSGKAIHLCHEMLQQSVTLDETTILWMLRAWSKTGSLVLLRQVHSLFLPK